MEIDKIGRGGFASVYKCKNYLDDQFYAVKKITLRIKDIKNNFQKELDRVLQEAKFIAKVNHPNLIRYYNSWLEVVKLEENKLKLSTKKQPDPCKKNVKEKFQKFQFALDKIDAESQQPLKKRKCLGSKISGLLETEDYDNICNKIAIEKSKNYQIKL